MHVSQLKKMNEVIESKEEDHSDQIGTCTEFKPGQKYATPSPGSGDR